MGSSNHIYVRVQARKFTTHEPDDFDETYLAWIKGQIDEALEKMKFIAHTVSVTVEKS